MPSWLRWVCRLPVQERGEGRGLLGVLTHWGAHRHSAALERAVLRLRGQPRPQTLPLPVCPGQAVKPPKLSFPICK